MKSTKLLIRALSVTIVGLLSLCMPMTSFAIENGSEKKATATPNESGAVFYADGAQEEMHAGGNDNRNFGEPTHSPNRLKQGGLLVTMRTLDFNEEKIKQMYGTAISPIKLAYMMQTYDKYPDVFRDKNNAGKLGYIVMNLVTQRAGAYYLAGPNQKSNSDTDYCTTPLKCWERHTNTKTSEGDKVHHSTTYGLNDKLNVAYSAIKNNPTFYEKYKNRELTLADLKAAGLYNVPTAKVQEFVYLFDYVDEAYDWMNAIGETESNDYDRSLRYLDFLLIVNALCNYNYASEISTFLESLNNPDINNKMVAVQFGAATAYGPENGSFVYTPLTYFRAISDDGGLTNRQVLDTLKIHWDTNEFGNYLPTDDPSVVISGVGPYDAGDIQRVYNNLVDELNLPNPGLRDARDEKMDGRNHNWVCQWFTDAQGYNNGTMANWGVIRYAVTMDLNNIPNGSFGWTSFCKTYAPQEVISKGTFLLTAKVSAANVEQNSNISIDVGVSTKLSKAQIAQFNTLKTTFPTVKPLVELTIDRKSITGIETSGEMLDSYVSTAKSAYKSVHKDAANQYTLKRECTWQEFDDYINGKKTFSFRDSGINVGTIPKSTWEYGATLSVKIGTTEITFKPRSSQKYISGNRGAERVSWAVKDPNIETGKYYSGFRTPFAEIKQGSPGNEEFEAMAGVPTTRDLYVGFGAQENMLNIEVERVPYKNATRKYTITYTNSMVYGTTQLCHVYCPGHGVGFGCGVVISPGYTDAQGNQHFFG